MKRGVWIKGVGLLVLVVLVVGLGACSRSAEEREGSSEATPVATSVSSGTSGQETAPVPGETVVSAVTQAPDTPGTEVEPTAAEATAVVEPTEEGTEAEATATPPPTSPPSSGGQVTHVVKRGETLSSIARDYDTTWQAIANANGITNPSTIYVGQELKIPTSGGSSGGSSSGGTAGCRYRHTVKRGEWVWQIARNYGVSPYAIMRANGMSMPQASTIYAGMVLCIP
jgi:LysM repeat protein